MGFFDFVTDFFSEPDQSHLTDPNRNPVGVAGTKTARLQRDILSQFGGTQEAGAESAFDVLRQGGRVPDRAGDLERRDIETQRQKLQQDISQRSAQAGLTGALGSKAVAQQGNLAARSQKAHSAETRAFESDRRRKQDLASIFQNVLGDAAGPLISSRQPALEDTRPTGFQNILGTGGNILGAAAKSASLASAFCWVARRVLGDNRWLQAREWMLDNLDAEQFNLYLRYGEVTANRLTDAEAAALRPTFERMVS
jgi:hypothetical protein